MAETSVVFAEHQVNHRFFVGSMVFEFHHLSGQLE